MTPLQFDRWKDFAVRMAKTCFQGSRRPDSDWILSEVLHFFGCLDEGDVPALKSWDDSDPYPKGHCCYGQERWPGHLSSPAPVCDTVDERLRGSLPDICCSSCRGEAGGYGSEECRCDEVEDLVREQWEAQWGGPVRCCIRAGLDFAADPSAGVVGFTAGDVRRMYPEGVPGWVFPEGERLEHWPFGPENGTFESLPDAAHVVL